MAPQPDDVGRIFRRPDLASSTPERYSVFFDNWRFLLRNHYGPELDPYIPGGLHKEMESRVCEFVLWQFMIGARGSSVMTQLAAINYLHSIRGLGPPLNTMTRLHQLLRARRRWDKNRVVRVRPE